MSVEHLEQEFDDDDGKSQDEGKDLALAVQGLKREKRNAKSLLTRLLSKLTGLMSEEEPDRKEMSDLVQRIEQQREATLGVVDMLEDIYRELKDEENVLKVGDEAEALSEQVDRETGSARSFLVSFTRGQSRPNSVVDSLTSERMREKQRAEIDARRQKDRIESEIRKKREELLAEEERLHAAEEEVNKRRQELNEEINNELGLNDMEDEASPPGISGICQSRVTTNATNGAAVQSELLPVNNDQTRSAIKSFPATHTQLERIKIPVFTGTKMEYQRWDAAFTSCVDQTPLTPQFKMLRLQACLAGEAAETIRGLGYSQEAYDAAKARLFRKYGVSRRQVQSHLEELKNLKPLKDNSATEFEIFADVLERAVISLKENGRGADLEAGTLYTIILEKIPERTLAQYYRWTRENEKRETLETLKDWVSLEAEFQTQASEIKHGLGDERGSRDKTDGRYTQRNVGNRENGSRNVRLFLANRVNTDKRNRKCPVCPENHPIWKCGDFRGRTAEEKWRMAKRFGLCYRCLADDHIGSSCLRSRQCNVNGCKENHHRLLHCDPRTGGNEASLRMQTEWPQMQPSTSSPRYDRNDLQSQERVQDSRSFITEGNRTARPVTMETIGEHENKLVALRTIPVILKNGNKRLLINCLLDEGSDTTYVNEDVVAELGFIGQKKQLSIKVANDQTISFMSTTFPIGLESTDGRVDTEIIAKTSKRICGGMKPVNWLDIKHKWNHLQSVPFPKLAEGGMIDVLLGADHYELMYSMKEVVGKPDEPYARLCPLGWTAMGKIGGAEQAEGHYTGLHHTFKLQTAETRVTNIEDNLELNALVKRFWDLESIGITSTGPQMTPHEKLAWDKVDKSVKFDGKHYQVAVPWREDRPRLPNNLSLAKKRLVSTERKLFKEKGVAAAYQQVLNDYLDKQYIRKVPPEEPQPESEWLLPHFPVVRPDKSTTKVRIVFDGSAPFEGKSLNTEALTGPKLQSDVFDILVKFRKEEVALVGDISQMYHQLVLPPEDRPFHRFLWRDLDQSKEPEVYEFLRFVFDGCYCPFCAQYTWQRHAQDHQDQYPMAAIAVKKHCYMDDLMPSLESTSKAKETRRQLTEMGDKAGFHIRKWISNRTEVLVDIPEEDRASEIDLDKNYLPVTKTLGVSWTARDDQFLFYYSPPGNEFQYTKRSVLKKTATLFDPLGFLSPFVVKAKLLLQQAWLEEFGWDETLPDKFKSEWEAWFNELEKLQEIKIPRCLKKGGEVKSISIHTFSDASEKAYAAAVYARHEYKDSSTSTQLIAAKTRLAPLKAMSIPRLELMGALIGLRLTKQVCSALEVAVEDATFWVDSMNVGYWIRGQSRDYKPFVAHRVGEIHTDSNPQQWRYVPTKLNPADHGTRGLTVTELVDNNGWWEGPEFLKQSEDTWPSERFESPTDTREEMKKRTDTQQMGTSSSFVVTTERKIEPEWRLNPCRFSKWYRTHPSKSFEIGLSLVRVRSWVHRFTENCRKPNEERIHGELTPEELTTTEKRIIADAQREAYVNEIKSLKDETSFPKKSSIQTLTPIWLDGLLRSNTRLRYSEDLPDEVKYPIILPKNQPATRLIVKYHHETEGHEMGVNFTLNHLREKYLVVHGREAVKKTIKECSECKRRFRGKPATQQMAPLPCIRLEATMRPFTNCAVDFAGPYLTVQGRGKPRSKRYLCLFLCLQTHCCHLEMAWSLETDGFLKALTRMVARRGWPRDMLSDNGTNFIGGNKEIRQLVDQIDQDKVQLLTSNKGIRWHWNPPTAPHFGGVFERMIKSAKRAAAAVLRNADVNDEELQTVFVGVESLMNSRPLTALSGDPNDEPVLTPNHFLVGHMGGELAPESVDTTTFNPRKRWRRIQELIRHVWQRWMREYLTSIGSRQKWFHPERNIKEGDVVLIVDTGIPRRQWKIGRIEQTYPGQDGCVRVVDVKEGGKIYRRPISRISPLEFDG